MRNLGARRWWALGAACPALVAVGVLSAGYIARLHLAGLPAPAAAAARQSVFGGVAVAQKFHSAPLLTSVQTAFVHGMDLALLVCGGFALAGLVLTLPRTNAPTALLPPRADSEPDVLATR